ncbi:MAG: hypothetical protein Q4A67_00360 [Aerococcus sp.]|nr:hypothetical protein [Aerococcus sp.]
MLQFKRRNGKTVTIKKPVIKRIPVPNQVKTLLLRRILQQNNETNDGT